MLVKKIIYPWKEILIIDGNLIKLEVVYTRPKGTIYFLQIRPKNPKVTLSQINPLSKDVSAVLSTFLTLLVSLYMEE